jgi:hypothetical protein
VHGSSPARILWWEVPRHVRCASVYKGINRFLSRLKTTVANFSNYVRRPLMPRGERPSAASLDVDLSGDEPQRKREAHPNDDAADNRHDEKPSVTPYADVTTEDDDDTAWVPFTAEHRLALRIGESSHGGHAFVRETAKNILNILEFQRLTCAEIAQRLNRVGSAMPRSGKWDSILVYHFTRHYMNVRPAFFSSEDFPRSNLYN